MPERLAPKPVEVAVDVRRVHLAHAVALALLTGLTTVAAHGLAGGAHLDRSSLAALFVPLLALAVLARALPRNTVSTIPLLVAGQLTGHLAQAKAATVASWRPTPETWGCAERLAAAPGGHGMHHLSHSSTAGVWTTEVCTPVPLTSGSPGVLHHLLGMGAPMAVWHLLAVAASALALATGGWLLTHLADWLDRLPRLLAPLDQVTLHRHPLPWHEAPRVRTSGPQPLTRRGPPRTGAPGHAAIGRA